MSLNPYESPSAAGFDEVTRARMVLDSSQRSVVWRFLLCNRLVALTLLAIGIVTILAPLFLLIALQIANPHPVGLIFNTMIGGVIGAWGFLQLKRNIAAISLTGAVMVGLFALAVIPGVLSALSNAKVQRGPPVELVEALPKLALAVVLTWALVFVPVWLVVRAWLWRLQGIDLTALEKIEYRPQGGDLA